VQQQLEAVATQRMMWHGEVWPQQPMDWEIEQDNEREAGDTGEEASRWRTTLSLTTPRLGRVDANLQLSANGVRITLATPYGASAADLRDAAPQLAEALAAAGVPLLAFQVKHEDEYAPPEAV
jgi:flagellar hook-length control protein FliK